MLGKVSRAGRSRLGERSSGSASYFYLVREIFSLEEQNRLLYSADAQMPALEEAAAVLAERYRGQKKARVPRGEKTLGASKQLAVFELGKVVGEIAA